MTRAIALMQGVFKDQPVERAWLFGSYSRGEERADSDIDIMVQYEESATISLFRFPASQLCCRTY